MPESTEGAMACDKIYCTGVGRVYKTELLEYVKIKNRM